MRGILLNLCSKTASTYAKEQWQKDMINKVHSFLLANLAWTGVDFIDPSTSFEKPNSVSETRHLRVLDYACGPGTMTNILAGHATEFVGVDVSENMVKAYNERFACGGENDASPLRAKAVVGNLLDPLGPSESLGAPQFFDFDLAIIGFGFHHFQDLTLATKRLVSRLKPGAVFVIVDFVTHAKFEGQKDVQNLIAHHGFSEEDVNGIFGGAGLVDIAALRSPESIVMKSGKEGQEQCRDIFMGRGRKPAL